MKLNTIINVPSVEEEKAALDGFFSQMAEARNERRVAAVAACEPLQRLIEVMRNRTGQSYKARALLYSLWNGQSTSLIEVLGLDWAIRKDICAVILAFGFEEQGGTKFFYDTISDALRAAGLFEWFIEAHEATG